MWLDDFDEMISAWLHSPSASTGIEPLCPFLESSPLPSLLPVFLYHTVIYSSRYISRSLNDALSRTAVLLSSFVSIVIILSVT